MMKKDSIMDFVDEQEKLDKHEGIKELCLDTIDNILAGEFMSIEVINPVQLFGGWLKIQAYHNLPKDLIDACMPSDDPIENLNAVKRLIENDFVPAMMIFIQFIEDTVETQDVMKKIGLL